MDLTPNEIIVLVMGGTFLSGCILAYFIVKGSPTTEETFEGSRTPINTPEGHIPITNDPDPDAYRNYLINVCFNSGKFATGHPLPNGDLEMTIEGQGKKIIPKAKVFGVPEGDAGPKTPH